jgi:hypothetical protein
MTLPEIQVVLKFRCIICGKLTAGRKPRAAWTKGDGTARFPRRHKIKGTDKPCPGNIIEATWVEIRLGVQLDLPDCY